MAASNLITPVAGGATYPSIPAGSDRLVFRTVLALQGAAINATAATSVTIGGVAGTWVAGDPAGTSQIRAAMNTWMWKESQISSISGGAVVVVGAVGSSIQNLDWGVQGASQINPTRVATGYVATGAISMSLARVADSYTAFFAAVAIAEDITLTNPSRTARISNINIGYAAGTAQTVNSTTQSKTYVQTAHVLNIEPVPPYDIVSVNGGEGITPGGNIGAVISGFTAAPNSGVYATKTLTTFGGTPTNSTSVMPYYADGQIYPNPIGGSYSITLTVGSESATEDNIPLNLPAGHVGVTFSGIITSNPNLIGYHLPGVVDGDKFVYPTAIGSGGTLTVDPDGDGDWSSTAEGTATCWWWDASTGVMTQCLFTFNDEGEIVSAQIGLTAIGLTVTGLTVRGLTARGL